MIISINDNNKIEKINKFQKLFIFQTLIYNRKKRDGQILSLTP